MPIKCRTTIPVVDAHVHLFPDPLYEAVKNWFAANAWEFQPKGSPVQLAESYLDGGLAGMVVLPYAHRPGVAGALNRFTGRLANGDRRVTGLGTVHPLDANPADIIRQAAEEYGLKGIKLHTHVQGTAPDDPAMFVIYEEAIRQGIPVVNHAGREPALDGYRAEVRAISGADRVRNALTRYPELTMVIPHLGFDEADRFLDMLDEFPNLYLDTTMVLADYFGVEVSRDSLARHAGRIMFGTDFPHIPYPVETELDALLALDLDEAALTQILSGTAAAVFGFNPAS